MQPKNTIRDFLPLIIIFSCIFLHTIIRLIQHGTWDTLFVIRNFEGAFFIVFGAFKLLNWRGFVDAANPMPTLTPSLSLPRHCF